MTHDEFLVYVEARVARVGSQTKLARQLGISVQSLNNTLSRRRPPSPDLLKALGFTLTITYTLPDTFYEFKVENKP